MTLRPWLSAVRSSAVLVAALLLAAVLVPWTGASAQQEVLDCEAARPSPLVPTDPALCASLAEVIRHPSALPLGEYEEKMAQFLSAWCHRGSGWTRDKGVRDTGPFTASFVDGRWVGEYHGTHQPVVIWYSQEMMDWLHENRPLDKPAPAEPAPIPDGAIMIKEMFPAPAASCAGVQPVARLFPTSGAAFMVRDNDASQDGWYWGYYGWDGFVPDYPANNDNNRLAYQGFGQYCMNCHASAESGLTFADLRNIEGEPGEPLVFLSQDFYDAESEPSHHRLVTLPEDDAERLGQPHFSYNGTFVRSVPAANLPKPDWDTIPLMPSETYDNTFVPAGGPGAESEFVTSTQCLGCHDAGSTGLQFDMTVPNPHGAEDGADLLNFSPYATWRTSPMGLGGRDPIFYAMLASETETFHPEASTDIQTICLGCHGIGGQRQFQIDHYDPETGECPEFLRSYANAIPWPPENPEAHLADYGALARDGITCTACHRMLVGQGDSPQPPTPENVCALARQRELNPDNTGFARTFTGSFLVGTPDELYGPFEDPKTKPMEHALGINPVYDGTIKNSELCGSCHTVHLPVLADGQPVVDNGKPVQTYEQTTYPEWAFSDYRTGETPQGELPQGAGPKAQSCQQCHMESADSDGKPFRSKIASIQERSNFPEAENALPGSDIDLEVREGFARHTLVGLNVFFVKMAQQFPDVLGIRTQDPMLVTKGLDPLLLTEQKMINQASNGTATVAIPKVETAGGTLRATVEVTSHVGHKLPSGVGFRRAFLELDVLDENGNVLWASGRTNGAGVLVDGEGEPLPGELWWKDDCSELLHPNELVYQPHYQKVTAQNQVQIYQELVTGPGDGVDSECGLDATPVPPLTTSFLSICGHVKDNRLLPSGFLSLDERIEISEALGAGEDMARDSGAHGVDGDPDYVHGGGDSLVYEVDLAEVGGSPAAVRATLYWQATPPYFLQDRFCTSKSVDTQRLYFLSGHLNLGGTAAEDWKLELVDSGVVAVP